MGRNRTITGPGATRPATTLQGHKSPAPAVVTDGEPDELRAAKRRDDREYGGTAVRTTRFRTPSRGDPWIRVNAGGRSARSCVTSTYPSRPRAAPAPTPGARSSRAGPHAWTAGTQIPISLLSSVPSLSAIDPKTRLPVFSQSPNPPTVQDYL